MTNEVLLPTTQIAVLSIGLLTPIVGYIINHFGPWVDEKVKGIIQLVVAAAAAGLYQAVEVDTFGWNNTTLQLVVTAILAALTAHKFFYVPSGISTTLGGGSNVQDKP